MKALITALILIFALPVYAGECENLNWKRIKRDGQYVTYRGHVKPGTSIIHAELWRGDRIIGQALDLPNPAGNWEIFIIADYIVRGKDIPSFYCN